MNHTETLGAKSPAAPLGAVIRVLDAPAKPSVFHLGVGVAVIGSAQGCDIVVSDGAISRSHVELELRPDGIGVRDLGSRNGTFYLGHRIEKAVLSLGSRISVGRAILTLDADAEALGRAPLHEESEYGAMIGPSTKMRELFGRLSRLEGSLVSTLIEGESGVGKELVAQALHAHSRVAEGPFVAVNCGAIARELVASELFGHRRGAFTGAVDHRRGAFECADGGTIFLDEIGELPLDLQPALLRVLESGEIRPLGGERTQRVNVRVVAATNRDLLGETARGAFREDLFYRIAVIRLLVPALRDRREDIAILANHFASAHEAEGKPALPPAIVEQLRARSWAGNVRELRNVVHAYMALGELPDDPGIVADALDRALDGYLTTSVPYADLKDGLLDRFTRLYLERLLAETNGNQSEAARVAGLDRGYLRRLLARFGHLD